MIMIAVILATRGLVFTEVEQAIADNLKNYDYKVFRSFTLPIPDCQNELVEQALKENPSYLLFVEEDTVMPEYAFVNMVKANADIACIDYGVASWGCVTRLKDTKEILWCGLGCTLIKREVFEVLEKPYFRIDKALRLNDFPKEEVWTDIPPQKSYGGQDIWFCMQARKKGFRIEQIEGECKHLKLEALGTAELNHGLHQIVQKPVITKRQEL